MTLLGVDYGWRSLAPPPAAIYAAGYRFVVRYISPDPSKNLTADERDELHAANLGILLVWESTQGRATQGVDAGRQDALRAGYLADSLGYPENVPLFFADDTDSQPAQVQPYFEGVESKSGAAESGCYGSLAVVDAMLSSGTMRWGFQASAWSGITVSGRAQLYQRRAPTLPLGGTFDEDVLLRPMPLWLPGNQTNNPVRDLGKEQDMVIIKGSAEAEFLVLGDGSVHVPTPNDVDLLKAGGIPEIVGLSDGLVTSITKLGTSA